MNDFLVTENGALKIENGDLVVGDATLQHQKDLLIAQKGEFKEFPEIGVGIANTLGDENPQQLLSQIRRNFQYDGMTVNQIQLTANGKLSIDAQYTS